jgi:RND superfamily putative drug exporter
MVFEKIANGVTKHYKLVIVVWIVALLVAVPAMMNVNSAVQYNTSFGDIEGYESIDAQKIISQNFKTSVANGTLLVLLQADNVTDADARYFVIELQKRIQSSSDLKYLENVSSVYTYSEMVMDEAILQLGPAMRPAEQNISMGAFFLWGIPAMHANAWNDTHSNSEAYNSTVAFLNYYLINADNNTKALAFGYYNVFAAAWNSSTPAPDPYTYATACVNAVGPTFISHLPAQMKAIFSAVLSTFNISNFTNTTIARNMMFGMVGSMASITNMTFLKQVYALGPNYTLAPVHALSVEIVEHGTIATYPIALPEQLTTNFVSASNKTMLLMVTFSVDSAYTETNGDKPLIDDTNILRGIINSVKADTSSSAITTYVTGEAAISADMQTSSESDMSMIEPITIFIIIVLMGVLFRSVVAWFLPLGAVGVAIGMSQALVFIIGTTIAQINSTVLTMLFAVLMGVGTDYSIFILTRYREERIKGATRERAVHTSVTWAGESIVTSGATVIIAFSAMAFASFSFVQTMGLLIGLSVVIALLVALTLVPALIMLIGNRMFWPTTGKRFENFAKKLMARKAEGNHGYFHQAASFAVKHAKVIIIVVILVSIPTTYIFATQESSFDFIGSMGNSESINGMNAMTNDFGAGKIMPTQVVITGTTLVYDNTTGTFNYAYLDAIDNVTARIAGDSMVQKASGITRPYGQWVDYRNLSALPAEARVQIETAMLSSLGSDSKSVLITVVLKDQPQSGNAVNYISTLRGELAVVKANQPMLATSSVLVGGESAIMLDMSKNVSEQFTNIEIIVIIGIFVVLMVVLGSMLLPAFAVLSIALSITWSFALTTIVFGYWLGKPILFIIPLILFVMLMGIGMDYNVFILTRIREEAHKGKDQKKAVIDAVDWTGGIITALALIMGGAFGSIMLSSNAMLQEFGFALLVAVLLDAMVVRTYIVPAAIVLMGKWAWWAPGRLQRVGREEKMQAKQVKNGRQKTE